MRPATLEVEDGAVHLVFGERPVVLGAIDRHHQVRLAEDALDAQAQLDLGVHSLESFAVLFDTHDRPLEVLPLNRARPRASCIALTLSFNIRMPCCLDSYLR